jgi:hypothetical protein
MLNRRGNAPRSNRNTLVFLAADRPRLEDLKQGVRQYLAWESIKREMESDVLNLDTYQRHQVRTKYEEANKTVEARIPETYTWLLVPEQPDPRQPDDLQELKLQPQPQSTLTANASRRLRSEDMLITQYAGTLLRQELDRIPLWRGNHVSLKDLADYFARYIYLPRLKNSEVLLDAIRNGLASILWQHDTFAYADGWDEAHQRYLGLKAGQQVQVTLNASALLVKPEVAAAQFAADAAATQAPAPLEATTITYPDLPLRTSLSISEHGGAALAEPNSASAAPAHAHLAGTTGQMMPTNAAEKHYHRFYGSVKINPRLMAGDAGKIMEEVVKHLTTLYGASVQVTLEIQATLPNGAPESTRRTVEENCRTLHFDGFGFEEE